MNSKIMAAKNGKGYTAENIARLRQMLGELSMVAKNEGADMLCYLMRWLILKQVICKQAK